MTNKILAGPILRRTTKNRICVWLATAEPMRLQLTITNADGDPLGTGGMDAMNPGGIPLGDHLFVHLLQARPAHDSGYPLDTFMYYRVDVIRDGAASPLFSEDEIREITYGDHPQPSFFIPSKLKNALHGSCRKPHGERISDDALIRGHEHMLQTSGDPDNRPAVLLLTGDQIYADDVALALGALLREQASALTGWEEEIPQIGSAARIPLHGRKRVLAECKSGFSSGESENHLLSFGEYAAMYLYVFGNLSAWTLPNHWDDLKSAGIAGGEEESARKAYEGQKPFLDNFHEKLPHVRRLLANIPTYMLFDDHDVTDDWNISHSWYDDVRESETGRRIVSNALAACWAFQSWGNDPDNFGKDMVWSIQQRLNDRNNDPTIAERYDLHTWKHRGWGFSIPTSPPIIAMDSRTQRQYDNYNMPAQLMDRYALDWLRVEWAKLVTDNRVLPDTWPVFVAATPVLGFTPIERLQDTALRFLNWGLQYAAKKFLFLFWMPWLGGPLDRKLVNIMDIESWSANKNGYKALFDVLQARMNLPGCVFLSGDVHYAFSAKGEFVCDGKTLECVQLTSSAVSNAPSAHNGKLLKNLGDELPKGYKHGPIFAWGNRKRWSVSSTLMRPKEIPSPIHADGNIGLLTFYNEGRIASHTLLITGDKESTEDHMRRTYEFNDK